MWVDCCLGVEYCVGDFFFDFVVGGLIELNGFVVMVEGGEVVDLIVMDGVDY